MMGWAYRVGNARCLALAIGIGLVLHGWPAAAKENEPWRVAGKLIGKPEAKESDSDKSHDVSGVACATTEGFPRKCLLVDDETQGAQIVILNDGSLVAGDFIRLIYNVQDGKPVELDAEGVAFADGDFFVVGSHGRPRHEAEAKKEAKNKAKAEASRYVFRIRFDLNGVDHDARLTGPVEIKTSTKLPKFIKDWPELAPSFDRSLEDNGLTIEGVAVKGEKIYFGMRGPVLPDKSAAILSVPLLALFDGQSGNPQLHHVNLEKSRGVRDLVAFENGFLLIAGPVNDPPDGSVNDGDYSVYWWDGINHARRLDEIKSFGNKVKPEGILPIDQRDGKLRVLLFFDGPDEGAPRPIEIARP